MNRKGKEGEQKQKSKRGDSTAHLQHLTIDSDSGDDEDTTVCPLCGLVYPDTSGLWIGCDACYAWLDLKCTEDCIPDVYYCPKCRV